MTSWDYRVVRKMYGEKEWFGIHEVFYDEYREPILTTENPISVLEETQEHLAETLIDMIDSFSLPVLDYSDFEDGGKFERGKKKFLDDCFGGADECNINQ